jgi:hypothetical protein
MGLHGLLQGQLYRHLLRIMFTFINAIYSSVVMGVFLMVTARNNCGTIAVRHDKFGAVEDCNISWNCVITFLPPDILFKNCIWNFTWDNLTQGNYCDVEERNLLGRVAM